MKLKPYHNNNTTNHSLNLTCWSTQLTSIILVEVSIAVRLQSTSLNSFPVQSTLYSVVSDIPEKRKPPMMTEFTYVLVYWGIKFM